MSVEPETCASCGRVIGPLDQAYLWREAVVCADCYIRLNEAALVAPPSPRPRPPRAVFREKMKSPGFRLLGIILALSMLAAAWRIIIAICGPHYLTAADTKERLAEAGLHPRIQASSRIFRGRELIAYGFTRDVNLPQHLDLTAYFDIDDRLTGISLIWEQHRDLWPTSEKGRLRLLNEMNMNLEDPTSEQARRRLQKRVGIEGIQALTGYQFDMAAMKSRNAFFDSGPWAVTWALDEPSEYTDTCTALITLERWSD